MLRTTVTTTHIHALASFVSGYYTNPTVRSSISLSYLPLIPLSLPLTHSFLLLLPLSFHCSLPLLCKLIRVLPLSLSPLIVRFSHSQSTSRITLVPTVREQFTSNLHSLPICVTLLFLFLFSLCSRACSDSNNQMESKSDSIYQLSHFAYNLSAATFSKQCTFTLFNQ